MAIERLPERARTPAVARAMFSPSAILLGGGAASLAILAGLWPLAPVVALVGWGAKVALAVPRDRRSTINPGRLPDPWRTFVLEAAQAAKRFNDLVVTLPTGPLRSELAETGQRVETAAFEARDRLRVLNAQLDEAVASVVEMSLRPASAGSAGAVRGQVNGIVDELEALRLALDETDTLSAASSPDAAASSTLEQR